MDKEKFLDMLKTLNREEIERMIKQNGKPIKLEDAVIVHNVKKDNNN